MNEIDTSQAGWEFDAWIAREIFKLDVVGEARCRNYDGSGWSIVAGGWSASELDRYPIRPVHVGHCICDLNGLDDVPMFGHFCGCLEVVKWYSSDIAAAWNMEERIAERNLWREYADHLCAVVGYSIHDEWGIKVGKADPWNIAHATPLQRCQAAYTALSGGGE